MRHPWESAGRTAEQAGPHCRVVEIDTLDNLTGSLNPDVIKVDIEGAEGRFLNGGLLTLQRDKPTLLMEINSELLPMPLAIRAIVETPGETSCHGDLPSV